MQHQTFREERQPQQVEKLSNPSTPVLGIYTRDPCDIAKTLARPATPAFGKAHPWRMHGNAPAHPQGSFTPVALSTRSAYNSPFYSPYNSPSGKRDYSVMREYCEIEGEDTCNTPESPVVLDRYGTKRCNHPVVSLF